MKARIVVLRVRRIARRADERRGDDERDEEVAKSHDAQFRTPPAQAEAARAKPIRRVPDCSAAMPGVARAAPGAL
jgi:hypothetical protein